MPDASFRSPIDDRWFEDYVPGDTHRFGRIEVDADEVLDFARRFDPQPFHIDENAARNTIFGGIIASGWHTGSMMMREFADHYLSHNASLSSPGLDNLRWPAPVRPGDRLGLRVSVMEARASASKPDRGVVRSLIEVLNQAGVVVMSVEAVNLLKRRPAPDA
ncbi:MAG: MaoC family dehydratase [Burkholderiaceae bacterium]